jgi:predicted dehydrogenase
MGVNAPINRKLRMGLVGGGQGAFIGRVHVSAAVLDNRAELVAGALSSDPLKARESAPALAIAPERAYGSYHDMTRQESQRSHSDRIDFVTIATPNDTHFDIAKAFVEAGFHVMCDKPLAFDLAQAEKLANLVEVKKVVFAVTYNYTGYPLVRQARDMVRSGELGTIQAIRTCYLQGWLRTRIELEGQKQASWRTDPRRAGAAGCFGDIGTHAYNLGRFVTGLLPDQVSCTLKTVEAGRPLDDYGVAVVRYQQGAVGTITASQVSHGRENDLWIEIDGTKGALEWHQQEPNRMWLRVNGLPQRLYTRDPNASFASISHRSSCRLPSGHPEAFLEAFANIYSAAFDAMIASAAGQPIDQAESLYPNVADGVDGMNFVAQCVASSAQDGRWLPLNHPLCRS